MKRTIREWWRDESSAISETFAYGLIVWGVAVLLALLMV